MVYAILIGFVISFILVGFALGYHQSLAHNIKKAKRTYRAKQYLKRLDQLNYFSLTPKSKFEEAKAYTLSTLIYKPHITALWNNSEENTWDYRNFIIYFDLDNDKIDIDLDRLHESLGLTITFKYIFDELDELTSIQCKVGENNYEIKINYSDEDWDFDIFKQLSHYINQELICLNSKNKATIYGNSPYHLLIINSKIEKYLDTSVPIFNKE